MVPLAHCERSGLRRQPLSLSSLGRAIKARECPASYVSGQRVQPSYRVWILGRLNGEGRVWLVLGQLQIEPGCQR